MVLQGNMESQSSTFPCKKIAEKSDINTSYELEIIVTHKHNGVSFYHQYDTHVLLCPSMCHCMLVIHIWGQIGPVLYDIIHCIQFIKLVNR